MRLWLAGAIAGSVIDTCGVSLGVIAAGAIGGAIGNGVSETAYQCLDGSFGSETGKQKMMLSVGFGAVGGFGGALVKVAGVAAEKAATIGSTVAGVLADAAVDAGKGADDLAKKVTRASPATTGE